MLDGQGQMKNEKVAEPSDLVQEKVKSAREAGIDMITGLVNQIIEGFIPEEWELSAILNCCKLLERLLKKASFFMLFAERL